MAYTEPGWKNYQIIISHLISNSEFIIHYDDGKFSNLRQKVLNIYFLYFANLTKSCITKIKPFKKKHKRSEHLNLTNFLGEEKCIT